VQAYSSIPNDPDAKKARRFLKELRRYRAKRWGKTKLEKILESSEAVDFREAIKRAT
jgi:hypothetical protein